MVSAPLSPAVGRVHHPLWAKVSSLPRCDDRCLRPGPERVCSADARRAVDQQGRRFPHRQTCSSASTRARCMGTRSQAPGCLPVQDNAAFAAALPSTAKAGRAGGPARAARDPAAPLPAVPSADLRQGGTVPSDPEEMAAGVKAGRRPPAGAPALTPARTAPPSPAGCRTPPEMQRCLKTPANGVPRHHKVEPRGLEPEPLACKVAEWASSGVIRAWPAANSSVHHRQVALLLLHFAAAGSLSQRR
jgi:hypothetical protein